MNVNASSLSPDGIDRYVWETRYRWHDARGNTEHSAEQTWQRVAHAVAEAEAPDRRPQVAHAFRDLLADMRFLPGGRILANAGIDGDHTLFNCFVMGTLADDADIITTALREAASTLHFGGGIGVDFSPLGSVQQGTQPESKHAPGPLRLITLFDTLCANTLTGHLRPGALMATLRCDHPDILQFADAKRVRHRLRASNLSVLISDAFMQAVRLDAPWPLVDDGGQPVTDTLMARALWEHILRSAYDTGEPGVLFIDRINALDNLGYREQVHATNPCGEIPLPAYGACNLGSLNLTRFVRRPFADNAEWDIDGLIAATTLAVRFLDDVIDVSRFPLPRQAEQARGSRRIGLGITGLADSLIMLGLHYASRRARTAAVTALRTICHAAYRASCALAVEKGAFPWFDADALLARPFAQTLPATLRHRIARSGLRNSHLIAIAPAGSISLLAGAVSSGIEPLAAIEQAFRVGGERGDMRIFDVEAYAKRVWVRRCENRPLPATFVTAAALDAEDQLLMQSELQRYVDNAISKTVNLPTATPFAQFRDVYDDAYRLGLKGCTVYRSAANTDRTCSTADPTTAGACD